MFCQFLVGLPLTVSLHSKLRVTFKNRLLQKHWRRPGLHSGPGDAGPRGRGRITRPTPVKQLPQVLLSRFSQFFIELSW